MYLLPSDQCEQGFRGKIGRFPPGGRHTSAVNRTEGAGSVASTLDGADAQEGFDWTHHVRCLDPAPSGRFRVEISHNVRLARIQELHWIPAGRSVWSKQIDEPQQVLPPRRYSVIINRLNHNLKTKTKKQCRINCYVEPIEDGTGLLELLERLNPDMWTYREGRRPLRSTGAALSVGSSLLECLPGQGGHLVLFTTGPCTSGPASIASLKMSKKTSPSGYQESANEFYQEIVKRARSAGYTIDICTCMSASTPDRIGLSEMKRCADSTGGSIVSGSSYDCPQLQDHVQRLLCSHHTSPVYSSVLNIRTTRNLAINTIIGPCHPLRSIPSWLRLPPGAEGTSHWKLFNLNATTTLGVYLTSKLTSKWGSGPASSCTVQLITSYCCAQGHKYSRVTTVRRPPGVDQSGVGQSSDASRQLSATNFDGGAAAVLVTRWALHQPLGLDMVASRIEEGLLRSNLSFHGDHFESFAELMRRLAVVFQRLKEVENDCSDTGAYQRHWLARASVGELVALTNQHRRLDFVAISGLDAPSTGELGASTYRHLLGSFSIRNTVEQLYNSFYVDTSSSHQ